MMIRTANYESLADAITAFTASTKDILRDAAEHQHFTRKKHKQRGRAKSAGGNRQKKPGRGKRRY